MTEDWPLTVTGAAPPALRSLLIPRRGTVVSKRIGVYLSRQHQCARQWNDCANLQEAVLIWQQLPPEAENMSDREGDRWTGAMRHKS